MTLSLNKEVIEQHGLTIGESLYLFGKINKIESYELIENSLLLKGLIAPEYHDGRPHGYFIMNSAKELINRIIVESESFINDDAELIKLAQELKEIFPKGSKIPGHQWAEGVKLIVLRLKIFFKKYGIYSNEEIINAAKAYVESFNGNYQYMQTLKYFIFKDVRGESGVVEPKSQLLTYIENYDHIEELRCDWTSSLK